MNIIQESFQRLYPNKQFNYQTKLEYNRRLSDFNANISASIHTIKVNLNLQWKDIDDEIKIGLIQHLLLKVYSKRSKISTVNIDLYHNFIKNVHMLTPKVEGDPFLEASFSRVNVKFFDGLMEKPNLKWGRDSRRKLACYNFHNDTVSVSTLFKEARAEVVDLLMYHELLHKHHKFEHGNGRSSYHSPTFKRDENKYPDKAGVEKEISSIVRRPTKRAAAKKKRRGLFRFF